MRSAGKRSRDCAQIVGTLEGQDAGERDVVPKLDGGEGQIAAAGEAMQTQPGRRPSRFLRARIAAMSASQSREWITSGKPVSRAAAMCCRKLAPARRAGCCRSDSRGRPRRSPRFSGVARRATSALASISGSSCGIVRMGADRAEHLGKFLCNRKHLRDVS